MPNMAVSHEQVSVTDACHAAPVMGSSRDGGPLPKDIIISTDEGVRLIWLGTTILSGAAYYGEREDMIVVSQGCVRTNDRVMVEAAAWAYSSMSTDNSGGSDERGRMDDRCFVDVSAHSSVSLFNLAIRLSLSRFGSAG